MAAKRAKHGIATIEGLVWKGAAPFEHSEAISGNANAVERALRDAAESRRLKTTKITKLRRAGEEVDLEVKIPLTDIHDSAHLYYSCMYRCP